MDDTLKDMTVDEILAMASDCHRKTDELRQDRDAAQKKAISVINDIIADINSVQTELLEFHKDAGIIHSCFPDLELNQGGVSVVLERRLLEGKRKLTAILSFEKAWKELRRVKRESKQPLTFAVKKNKATC